MSRIGEVFSIAAENPAVPGCTVSMRETDEIYHFALAAMTDISAEVYPYPKLIVMVEGAMEVYTTDGRSWTMQAKDWLPVSCMTMKQSF